MDQSLDKEKYIMIPLNEWENNYKKQQEIINDLRYTIEHRAIEIKLHRSYGFGHVGYSNIAKLEITVSGGYKLIDVNREWFISAIQVDFNIDLTKSKEEEKKLLEAADKIRKLPKIVKWLFRIK